MQWGYNSREKHSEFIEFSKLEPSVEALTAPLGTPEEHPKP
jgi:hypothetical protein